MACEIPREVADVTPEWLKQVLKDDSIVVKDLYQHKTKDGVLSSIIKVKIDQDGTEKKLFIKIMPSKDLAQRIFIEKNALDKIELNAYRDVMPALAKFEKETLGSTSIQSVTCQFYAGDCNLDPNDRRFYIILDDLSDSYKMPNFSNGLTSAEIKDSVEKLAHFHALSFCMGQLKKIDYSLEHHLPYMFFVEDPEVHTFVDSMFTRAIEALDKRKYPGDEKLAPILTNISKNWKPLFRKAFNFDDRRFLVHGDVWANNVMFNSQSDCKLVDWQFVSASCPYLDFAAMAYINQTPEETVANLDAFYTSYYDKAKTICDQFKVPTPWSCKDDFKHSTETMGSLALFCWLVLSFSPCVHSPRIYDRFIYVMETAIKYNPDHFKEFL